MPYIKTDRRIAIMSEMPAHVHPENTIQTAGELNYFITNVLCAYVGNHGKSYQTFNDISGVMTECLAEFRRRVIAPYEDTKIAENGDCY